MGLGPPVCTKCRRVMAFTNTPKVIENKSVYWSCSCGVNQYSGYPACSSLFCYSKEEQDAMNWPEEQPPQPEVPLCNKCKAAPVTYDVPDKLCDTCWANWYIEGWEFSSEEERQEVLQEIKTLQIEG